MTPQVEVDRNYVVVQGIRIERQASMSPTQWLEYWETEKANFEELNVLMMLMAEGTRKIDAIKQHRQLTGAGLKESKDAVEKYWVSKPQSGTLSDILGNS